MTDSVSPRIATLACALLVACTQPVAVVDETAPPPIPAAVYEQAVLDGAAVYRIDPQQSLILVHVGRDGAMQRLGHDHAVASEDISGMIALYDDAARSHADVALPIRNLVVDAAQYRERLGLDTDSSPDDIAGTYTNMLKVFEPELYPWVQIHVRVVAGSPQQPEFGVSMTLYGATREFVVPATLESTAQQLVVSGSTAVRHSDFGVEPYSAAGGLLRVADEMQIEFRFVARRDRF